MSQIFETINAAPAEVAPQSPRDHCSHVRHNGCCVHPHAPASASTESHRTRPLLRGLRQRRGYTRRRRRQHGERRLRRRQHGQRRFQRRQHRQRRFQRRHHGERGFQRRHNGNGRRGWSRRHNGNGRRRWSRRHNGNGRRRRRPGNRRQGRRGRRLRPGRRHVPARAGAEQRQLQHVHLHRRRSDRVHLARLHGRGRARHVQPGRDLPLRRHGRTHGLGRPGDADAAGRISLHPIAARDRSHRRLRARRRYRPAASPTPSTAATSCA